MLFAMGVGLCTQRSLHRRGGGAHKAQAHIFRPCACRPARCGGSRLGSGPPPADSKCNPDPEPMRGMLFPHSSCKAGSLMSAWWDAAWSQSSHSEKRFFPYLLVRLPSITMPPSSPDAILGLVSPSNAQVRTSFHSSAVK